MSPTLRPLTAGLLFVLYVTGSACCSTADVRENLRSAAVDSYVRDEMHKQHIPGLSIAVIQNCKLVKAKGYGFANVEHDVLATPYTIYQSGSVAKQFTAALVMLLSEEGKFKLDDPVVKYLPNAPKAWKEITIRNLLTHTSGIHDCYDKLDLRKDYTDDELMKIYGEAPLEFAPGEKWSYSNMGYHVLGFLCTKVGGKFYGDQLQQRILKPLGMNTARIISEKALVRHRAAGYEFVKGSWCNQDWVSPSLNRTADGGLYLSVLDMAMWDLGLCNDKLLKKGVRDQLWTPVTLNSGKTAPYGFGWVVSSMKGRRLVEHSGAWQGFSTNICRFVDDKITVIVLSNVAGASPDKIAHEVAAYYVPALEKGHKMFSTSKAIAHKL